ncbi:hypothetical protein [uncultured Fusobacterium sp.]|uniref:hypothetical protein n=1 Tax=uncultured Fusobacterium sp. TaxID=159267 RepID=UPI0025F7B9D5|nr:hypothetical protein [uncultured Fusobacterium sp.]
MSRFIIRSLDSYNEKSYEIVTGKKIATSEAVEYEYLSKLGKCKISVLKDRVIIDRDNNGIATILDVDMKRETEFVYYGEGFKKEFTLKGENLSYKDNILDFTYKILDGGEEVNIISITIKEY